jgi:tRNA-dihydrouridine synthase
MTTTICLAPLRGVTDAIFRNLFDQCYGGVDWAVAPFVSTVCASRTKNKFFRDLLPQNNCGMPVVPQLMSKSAVDFMAMAAALFDMGYGHINWNLGCPYPMVAKKGRGSGLLPYPERIEAFLDRVVPAIPNRLSIKMRLGRFSKEEILELLPILDRYPLELLIVHPRTGVQMYEGRPDLEAFSQCLLQTRHPLIYNGDIVTRSDLVRLRRQFPEVSAWMIGRGAVQDPYLPLLIKERTMDDAQRLRRFERFHGALVAAYETRLSGPSHLLGRMKCLWGYFQGAFVDGRRIAKQIRKTRSMDRYWSITENFFAQPQQWVLASEVEKDRVA